MNKHIVIILFLVLGLLGFEINDVNHPPFSINKNSKIGSFAGNTFYHTLKGSDPDGDNIYFLIDNDSDLSNQGVYCEIFHSNQLGCEIDKDITIPTTSQCVMNDNYTLDSCKEMEIIYHIVDEQGTRSKGNDKIILYITNSKIDEKYLQNDPTNNPRAFLNEMNAKTTTYNSGNVGIDMLNSDMFTGANSIFKKQLDVASNSIDNLEADSLKTTDILNNNTATNALGDSIGGVNSNLLNNLVQDSIDSLSYNNLNIPIDCFIKREDSKIETYYICEIDPNININQNLATKYVYNTQDGQNTAYETCKDNCQNTQTCNTENITNITEFFKNLNYIDDATYNSVLNNISNMDDANQMDIYVRDSAGKLIDNFSISQNIQKDDIYWDATTIPSSRTIINEKLELHTDFMGEAYFETSTSGNSFIITPKISYWMKINGNDILKSYDASELYTIAFQSNATKYRCPIPTLDNVYYTSIDSCNNQCSIEHDCLQMMKQKSSNTSGSSIKNYCKTKTVSINGARISLEQAVKDGTCKLEEEFSIDSNDNIAKYYVQNYLQQDGFRPNIGFKEDASILTNERAIEVTYAFADMLKNGKSENRFDETSLLDDSDLFRDFDFKESNSLTKSLAVITGRNFTDMNVYVLTKINPLNFDIEHKDIFSDKNVTTPKELKIYQLYDQTLQREPTFDEVQTIKNNSALITDTQLKKNIYDSALDDDNTIGITIGLFAVKEPAYKDENATNKTVFYIMDNTKTLRLVSITGGDVKPIDDKSKFLYNEYFKYLGREPDITGFLWWYNDLKNGTSETTLDASFRQAITETPHRMQENSFYMENISASEPQEVEFNNFLNNMSLARKGVFNKNTMSFESSSEVSEDEKQNYGDVSINKYIYNNKLSDNLLFLKSYNNSESTISKPILVNANSMPVKTDSLAGYTYYYLFAYVDKIKNMKNKTVKDMMDIVWEDYKSGKKDYFVWDYVDRDKAVKKISDTSTTWKKSQEISNFGRYFKPNMFKKYSNNDIVTSAYEDITENKNDSVYIAKRGDNYIVKMAAADKREYDGDACNGSEYFDAVVGKCISKEIADNNPYPAETDYTSTNCPHPNQSVDESGKCYTNSSSLMNVSNQNGYYFVYLQKDDNSSIDFLTPLVDSSQIQCLNEYVKCELTNEYFNSQESCQLYCKENTNGVITAGECTKQNTTPTTLINDTFYNLNTCDSICFKKDIKKLNFINTRLRVGDDIASFKSDISIKKFDSNGVTDYSSSLVQTGPNVYLNEDNSGIKIDNLQIDDEIEITYNSVITNNKYQIGLGKADENLLNNPTNITNGYIPSDTLGTCANIKAYYPTMGIYLDIDYDGDGFMDDSIRISDTFVCNPSVTSNISQTIKFKGNKIEYEYIDYRGVKSNLTKDVALINKGICSADLDANGDLELSKVSLAQHYLTNEYVPEADELNIYQNDKTIPSKMKFARKLIEGNLGKITKSQTQVEQYFKTTNPTNIFNMINVDKNIPIPFYEGISDNDDLDVYFKNTGLDSKLNNNVAGYTIKAGYGYTPWEECKSYLETVAGTSTEEISKTSCEVFGIYNEDTKLCETNADYSYTQIPIKTIKVKSLAYDDAEYAYYKGVSVDTYNDFLGYITVHNLFDPIYASYDINSAEDKIVEDNDLDPVGVVLDDIHINNPSDSRGIRLTILDENAALVSSNVYDTYENDNISTKLSDLIANSKKNYKLILNTVDAWSNQLSDSSKTSLKTLGASESIIDNLENNNPRTSYILVTTKTDDGWNVIAEKFASQKSEVGAAESIQLTNQEINFNCPQGTLDTNRNICIGSPTCPDGSYVDPQDNTRCKKDKLITVKKFKKICKPWWKIKRTYVCNNLDSGFNMIDNITSGPPRMTNICKQKQEFDRGFSIINGNVEIGN